MTYKELKSEIADLAHVVLEQKTDDGPELSEALSETVDGSRLTFIIPLAWDVVNAAREDMHGLFYPGEEMLEEFCIPSDETLSIDALMCKLSYCILYRAVLDKIADLQEQE